MYISIRGLRHGARPIYHSVTNEHVHDLRELAHIQIKSNENTLESLSEVLDILYQQGQVLRSMLFTFYLSPSVICEFVLRAVRSRPFFKPSATSTVLSHPYKLLRRLHQCMQQIKYDFCNHYRL